MAAGDNQKLKMLYLVKVFSEETDEEHTLSSQEIMEKLAGYGVNVERRTLYQDIDLLKEYGLDIIGEQRGRSYCYHLVHRDFELPELKLLVDAVQSSKFITEKKSRELIKKLESLVSKHNASHLHRQVVISGRVKTINESIYYNVDMLHEAIGAGHQIKFHYYQWNIDKQMELRRNGDWYQVSPWCLMWDDENYYLVAYDSYDSRIKHFRVDKMTDLAVLNEDRIGKKEFREFDVAKYSKQLFGMFSGEESQVTVRGHNSLVGVFIDRFGKDLIIIPDGNDHFRTTINVALSRQFIGWIISLGRDIEVVGPEIVLELMKDETKRLVSQYLE